MPLGWSPPVVFVQINLRQGLSKKKGKKRKPYGIYEKKTIVVSELSKVNIQKSFVFLCTSNKQFEN